MDKDYQDLVASALHSIYLGRRTQILSGDATGEEIDKFIADTARKALEETRDMNKTDVMLDMLQSLIRDGLSHKGKEEQPNVEQ